MRKDVFGNDVKWYAPGQQLCKGNAANSIMNMMVDSDSVDARTKNYLNLAIVNLENNDTEHAMMCIGRAYMTLKEIIPNDSDILIDKLP